MSVSQFTNKDFEVIKRDYADLMESAKKRCRDAEEIEIINKAFEFANEAHKNIRRRSGEPYILHPIAVAKIVVSTIGLGCKSITAALLHDVVEDTDYTVEDIRNIFGIKVASLVEGLTKMKVVLDNQDRKYKHHKYSESIQAENFKRILLTMNDDVRVVLIKLADRLHNCRTIEFMPEHKRDKILSETMFIFIPLAHRLGLYEVKSEMENIWLRYKEPDAYYEISAKINRKVSDKEIEINKFIEPIDKALDKAGFKFEIHKRVKSPYSIWHKMHTKNISFEQVYDLYAVRIVFIPKEKGPEPERAECYSIFSLITGIYKYKDDRVRDWIAEPKSNGYEALHCTLMSHTGIWIEVQIRSVRMNEIAEKGIAAHWNYKKDGYVKDNDGAMDTWINKVTGILKSKDVNASELLDIFRSDLTRSEIFVFTPKGDQKAIVKGSTALDFAYSIHTLIGEKAIAAKVNMKLVPLSHVLRTGDQVEIITAENEHPKMESLSFLQTNYAKNKVIEYFRKDIKKYSNEGKINLHDRLREIGLKFNVKLPKKLLYAASLNEWKEFYFKYRLGLIKFDFIKNFLTENHSSGEKIILASCCNPISGDPVIAFDRGDGTIIIHKKTCPDSESHAAKHGDKIVRFEWSEDDNLTNNVSLSLNGLDRKGLVSEITEIISKIMDVNITRIFLGASEGVFEGEINLQVKDKKILESLIAKLNGIEGIQTAIRKEF